MKGLNTNKAIIQTIILKNKLVKMASGFFKKLWKEYEQLGMLNHLGIIPDINDIVKKEDNVKEFIEALKRALIFCKEAEIGHFSLFLVEKDYEFKQDKIAFLKRVIEKIAGDDFFKDIKISAVGDWTELEPLGDCIKEAVLEHKEEYWLNLNLFINYSATSEIIDACKAIARKITLMKLDEDAVNASVIEGLMKSSGPDIGLLLFFRGYSLNDFIGFKGLKARFYSFDKSFLEFTEKDAKDSLIKVGLARLS